MGTTVQLALYIHRSHIHRVSPLQAQNRKHRASRWLSGKNPPAKARDTGSSPRSGRSLGEGNSNPLEYSCLGSPMDRGAMVLLLSIIHEVTKESDTT